MTQGPEHTAPGLFCGLRKAPPQSRRPPRPAHPGKPPQGLPPRPAAFPTTNAAAAPVVAAMENRPLLQTGSTHPAAWQNGPGSGNPDNGWPSQPQPTHARQRRRAGRAQADRARRPPARQCFRARRLAVVLRAKEKAGREPGLFVTLWLLPVDLEAALARLLLRAHGLGGVHGAGLDLLADLRGDGRGHWSRRLFLAGALHGVAAQGISRRGG